MSTSSSPASSPRSTHSLRRRLLWLVMAAIALASVLLASGAYRSALRQADAMFDFHLQELARSVRGGVPFAPGADVPSIEFQVQIWGPAGEEIFRSAGTALPARAVLGFSDVRVEGVRYRVYSLQSAEHTIQVAQDLDAREVRARNLALNAVMPVALFGPLLMLAVWWLISRSLTPVEQVRRQVAARAADDLSALPDDGLPDEIQPLVNELNLLLERVRLAVMAQRQFVADAAHELRSPLTALKLQSEGLRRAVDEPSREAAVARLESGIERATLLVTQLLALARAEGPGETGKRLERVDLEAVARQAVGDALSQAQARRIDLGVNAAGPAAVAGQPELLRILLRNLLDNAIKYSPEGGQVDISFCAADGRVRLTVEDTGPGIPDSERERVFDRFYRGAAQAAVPGSGLGLAIVQSIVKAHGAEVVLGRSARLGGLKVDVSFPAPAGGLA